MNLAYTDAGNDPSGWTTRQAYDLLAAGFGPGSNGPLLIAAQLPAQVGPGPIDALSRALRSAPDVAFASPPTFNAARLLLMAVFRSVAVPLTAAVMNLLSVGAAYGVIVAICQWGWLGSVVGIGRTAPVDPWLPLLLLVDATLVRMVLVPATMELLGGANCWLPRWLDRVVPTISVDTPTAPPARPVLVDAR